MLLSRSIVALIIALAAGCASPPPAVAASSPVPLRLTVDATDAPRHVLRAHLVIPVHPGPLTLQYPKWIPGEHGPTGPLVNLVGPTLTTGGKRIAWQRDAEHIYEFHLVVPPGASEIECDLVFLEPLDTEGFSSGASTTAALVDLAWNHVLLYPKGFAPEQLSFVAQLRLPPGWKYGTALPVVSEKDGTIDFAATSLVTLIDSPVIAGVHARTIPLGPETGPMHEIDLVADSEEALVMTPQQIAAYKQLVAEAGALFGARHYRDYHFLYTLSDHIATFGLEHHESSDDRASERTLIEDDRRRAGAGLLPHEFVHSWNGKYRRPRGLATRDYQEPMRGDLLWVYEGLTEYLGWVLTGRSGLLSEEEEREDVARIAATLDARPGRQWRPLADTAVAAQILYDAPRAWRTLRRSVDYYDEGLLLWLEVDVIIRDKTQGKRSLDDFCQKFHGGKDTPPDVRPYDLDDVVRTLDEVAPNDWRTFFRTRVEDPTPHPPFGGFTEAGYRLAYDEEPNTVVQARLSADKRVDALFSIGALFGEGGEVLDIDPEAPAGKAGLAPGMHVVAVSGRRYSPDVLHDALVHAKQATAPIELIVENGEFYKTLSLDWHGGERNAHLVRDPSKPDLLVAILAPRTPRPAEAVLAAPTKKDDAKAAPR